MQIVTTYTHRFVVDDVPFWIRFCEDGTFDLLSGPRGHTVRRGRIGVREYRRFWSSDDYDPPKVLDFIRKHRHATR